MNPDIFINIAFITDKIGVMLHPGFKREPD